MKIPFYANPYNLLIISFLLIIISSVIRILIIYDFIKKSNKKKLRNISRILHILSLLFLASNFLLNNVYTNTNNYKQNIIKFIQVMFITFPNFLYFDKKLILKKNIK